MVTWESRFTDGATLRHASTADFARRCVFERRHLTGPSAAAMPSAEIVARKTPIERARRSCGTSRGSGRSSWREQPRRTDASLVAKCHNYEANERDALRASVTRESESERALFSPVQFLRRTRLARERTSHRETGRERFVMRNIHLGSSDKTRTSPIARLNEALAGSPMCCGSNSSGATQRAASRLPRSAGPRARELLCRRRRRPRSGSFLAIRRLPKARLVAWGSLHPRARR